MKQFIVDRHTTPNTPTLEQVPTEKVPIYETLAAAESDLANLNAGQIIATPDTGAELANVTDTVQAGNMHAVTSNAVYNERAVIQNGVTSTITTPSGGGTSTTNVVFNTPMADANYIVSLEINSTSLGNVIAMVKNESKTVNGFTIQSYHPTGGYTYKVTWIAFSLKSK